MVSSTGKATVPPGQRRGTAPGHGRSRRRLPRSVVAAVVVAGGCLYGPPAVAATTRIPAAPAGRQPLWQSRWQGTWSTAPVPPGSTGLSAQGFADQTLREIVHTSLGGSEVRIRLTNVFGTAPLTVDDASVGLRSAGASLASGSRRPVRFGGRARVVIPAGREVWSDPVPLRVGPDQDLAVSLFTRGATGPVTWHGTALTTSYYSEPGDHTGESGAAAFDATTTSWFLLDGVDVRPARPAGAVVAFGDSITDGTNSTPDAYRTWPQDLARRLRAEHLGMSVLDEGIAGNEVLTDAGTAGVSAEARFARDALSQTAVSDVVFLEGINDIGRGVGPDGSPLTVEELIDGIAALAEEAHREGVRIIGGTLTPIAGSVYDSPRAEEMRQEVNDWIRGSDVFDGVVDFDRAVRDPADPSRFLPRYDSGDHLHPGDAGYQAMADALDPALLDR